MPAILGLNCYKHDSAASLVVDGRTVAAAEEERFRRIKHFSGYPEKAVDYVLNEASLSPDEIDHFAFYMLPGLVMRENLFYSPRYLTRSGGLHFLLSQLNGARRMKNIGFALKEHLGGSPESRVVFVKHHMAHASAAVACSGFRRCAVLTMDGVGERDTSLLAGYDRGGYTVYSSSRFPHSPGMFYSAVTRYLGFMPDNDEFKVMGLSSYGQPKYLDLFREVISCSRGQIRVNTDLLDIHMGVHHAGFSKRMLREIGPPRRPGEPLDSRHEDIASSAQRVLEEGALSLARYLRKRSGMEKLVVSGGVGLNCVMNGILERESGFQQVYPLPPSNDAGTSLGAALEVHRGKYPNIPLQAPGHMYLGSSYSRGEIRETLETARLAWHTPEDLADVTAGLIEKGRIVALFNGRMEFGPRALGNRSILADPRDPDMKDTVNYYVKHREPFRPFCPSCLVEFAEEYFDGCTDSPYMIKTYPVAAGREREIPSVTHVDGTARVQTVSRETNPFYYSVIEAFRKRTGVPMVLNTSFNVRGEPIVESPLDAVRCFYGTGIDVLVMPPFLVAKPGVESEISRLMNHLEGD